MSLRELKGAMIGAGYFAGFQAEAWKRIPGVRIAAVADALPRRASDFAAEWGIPRAYDAAESMLRAEKPDFVDIVTRPDSHLDLTRLAASHGAQVICQKPLAPAWDDCVAMTGDCRRAGARLLVHENWRWQPWYREIKRLIEAGVFGRIFHIGFRMRTGDGLGREPYGVQPYFRRMPRLLIYETLIHFIDTFRFLAGEIETVFCRTRRVNPVIEGEDYAVIQIGFRNEAEGLIDANRISGPVPPEVAFGVLTLEGERAALRMTPQGDLFLAEHGKPESKHEYEKPERGYKGDSVYAAQRHYAECLRDGSPCETEGEEYLKTVRAMFACYESAETGRSIGLNG
jgi:predicted dehydrogenase